MNRSLPDAEREAPPRRAAARMLAASGVAHALLFLLSYALLTSTPGPLASDEELVAFYGSAGRNRLILVGLYVMPFAGITFLWFSAALRAWIPAAAREENEIVAGLQQASGILYVALFFAAAAASSVMAVSVALSRSAVDPIVARQFPQYGKTLLIVFAMRMAAMFVFTTSRLARRAGVLPRGFELVGMIAGTFLLFSTAFDRTLVLVFPTWILLLCTVILVRAGVRRASLAESS